MQVLDSDGTWTEDDQGNWHRVPDRFALPAVFVVQASGPLLPDYRVALPHLDAYVVMRNVRWQNKIGYEIEYGSLRYGHRGTWGRDSIGDAWVTFTDALEYIVSHWRPTH